MRQKRVDGHKRPKRHGDVLVEKAQQVLGCRLRRLFIYAFIGESREAMKAAYRLYRDRGSLAERFREFVYRAAHGLIKPWVRERVVIV